MQEETQEVKEEIKEIIEEKKIEDKQQIHDEIKPELKEEKLEVKENIQKEIKEEKVEPIIEEKIETVIKQKVEHVQVKKEEPGFFNKIKDVFVKKTLSDDKFEELFFSLELALLENNVALSVIDKIKLDLKTRLVDKKLNRFQIDKTISISLKESISDLFNIPTINIMEEIKNKKNETGEPYIISFVGINGVGKTTNLAKLANYFKKNGFSVIMVAGDTFRVAAIEQIEEHANNLDIKLIKHDYGSDPAAVCFDAIKHAKSKNIDVVLIDTAGRSNANINLMNELKKVIRISKSDLKIFVGDSLSGNDAVEQAENFNESVGIDGVILAKSDADEKGGTAISIGWVLKKPILFLGTGQSYDDLKEFSSNLILDNLGLN
ncbi:signal recognition particle-docking protein FtsY [Candidatus Woesearchaeota archaeon]|nr:signal recognition particle-docking protein FtsY [Candidatus Woesearchaeota archaeon]MBT5741477.1 signal recognition particle-docking protein FtsY [Candidatus Woesearchaeota archaeon]